MCICKARFVSSGLIKRKTNTIYLRIVTNIKIINDVSNSAILISGT
jgi:hypothetical protein